ncbi:MAG TPA: YhcH/YjgK/YiaL family protein [Mucilaginibacter sp.]|jgi:YhcH/YjgK/YiaL family protein
MKTSIACKINPFIFFLLFIISTSMVIRQTGKDWTEKDAKKWVKSKEWSHGLKVNVTSSVNAVEFAKQYHANRDYWDKAFTFMRDKNLKDLAPGKYVIDGDNVYATVTEAPSKTFEQSAWESHRKYIDLQYVVVGQEKIGVSPLSETTVTAPYDESKDIAHYTAKGKFYTATPDEFFLFFPNDAHRPNILVDGYDVVKKLVIKIKYAN